MAPRSLDIVLFSEALDWHARELIRGLRARGLSVRRVSLPECGFDTTKPFGIFIPGLNGKLPKGAFVRGIPAGSFEQITMRLGLLHALRELGVLVWNDARAIEACIDKSMTSHLLAKAGLPTPPTFAVQSRARAQAVAERELARAGRLVLKPLFGAQGRGIRLIERSGDLPEEGELGGAYYLQHHVANGERPQDFRVFVSAGRAVASMVRVAKDGEWITNVKQGGVPRPMLPNAELGALAEAACAVTGANYAGVDLMLGADGKPLVLEVNSMPAWRGLQSVTSGLNIGGRIAEDFAAALARHRAAIANKPLAAM
jgi:RimK family alpha-L-glutamate ligase